MAPSSQRLVGALENVVTAIDQYLDDAEMSGCDNYDLDKLVPVPSSKPPNAEPEDPALLGWRVKEAVIEVQRAYAHAEGVEARSEGIPLPGDGLHLWKEFLANSRVHSDPAAIYISCDRFRSWAEMEIARSNRSTEKPSWDGRPSFVLWR